jgi:hypothetical protein
MSLYKYTLWSWCGLVMYSFFTQVEFLIALIYVTSEKIRKKSLVAAPTFELPMAIGLGGFIEVGLSRGYSYTQ